MDRYLVVSYNEDEQEWFYDVVLAQSAEDAKAYVCTLRPYVQAADASTVAQVMQMVQHLNSNEPISSTDQPIAECQDCGARFPENQLNEIKDFSQRVEPGESCPAGECPDCGSLASRVDKAVQS